MLQDNDLSGFEPGMYRIAIAAMFGGLDESIQDSEPVYFLNEQWTEILNFHEAIRDILIRWFDEEIDSSNIVVEMPPILEEVEEVAMPQKSLSMRKIEKILRLKYEKGLTHRAIAKSCGVSTSTVSEYAKPNSLSFICVLLACSSPSP